MSKEIEHLRELWQNRGPTIISGSGKGKRYSNRLLLYTDRGVRQRSLPACSEQEAILMF